MGTFPNFSNIVGYAQTKLKLRKNNPYAISKLNAWIRVTSGVSSGEAKGLTIVSNPNFKLFGAAGISSIYGNDKQSGTVGTTWTGGAVNPSVGQGYRPSPTIESIEIDEGAGNLSRKASFSIKCFSREQMELVTKYFQEPGFSIFLEWGWNTDDGVKGIVKELGADTISNFNNFTNVNKRRELGKGEYDNYLGFITGGGLTSENDTWTVQVNCSGFTELPSYLVNGDNAGAKESVPPKPEPDYENLSGYGLVLGKKRWMLCFNALPSSRKTPEIKALETLKDFSLAEVPIASIVNYINFDPRIADKVNDAADGTWLSRAFDSGGAKQETDGSSKRIDIPPGTPLVDKNKFIRFGTLIRIINQRELKGLKLGKTNNVSMIIHSSDCICSAFEKMFSTDKSRLFIPNEQVPKFDFINAKKSAQRITEIPEGDTADCRIKGDGLVVEFPYDGAIFDGNIVKGPAAGKSVDFSNRLMKDARTWGLLDDLYVNFDFAAGILDSTNITIKDALYQILNGMSSAVNDLWNFQIIQTQAPNTITTDGFTIKKGDSVVSIKEVNFTPKKEAPPVFKFSLIGTDSIFKDSSLQLDMSGAKMNQVIGSRLTNGNAVKINKETQPNVGKLNAIGLEDLILNEVYRKAEEANDAKAPGTKLNAEEEKKIIEANFLNFLGKLGQYPQVDIRNFKRYGTDRVIKTGFDVNKTLYVASYDDKQLLKLAKGSIEKYSDISPLLPINFTFTIHGISGIKRGDKFGVIGIPKKYDNGFFQVIGIKHTIQGMEWTTEVTGGYRNTNGF